MTTLHVLGLGLHRTGTLSVKLALEQLGFGPCFHGFEAFSRADQAPLWEEAIERPQGFDWSRLFGEYGAATDWPMLYFWEHLVEAYPDAKVLLTERDPQEWYESQAAFFRESFAKMESGEVSLDPRMLAIFGRVTSGTIGDVLDREPSLAFFERHYARVREVVPAERLLSYHVGSGWGPLCEFLGVPVPDTPFPKVNEMSTATENYRHATTSDGGFNTTWT